MKGIAGLMVCHMMNSNSDNIVEYKVVHYWKFSVVTEEKNCIVALLDF